MKQQNNDNSDEQSSLLFKIASGKKKIESKQGVALLRLLTDRVKNGKSITTPYCLIEIALVLSGDAGNLDLVKRAIKNAQEASRESHG